METVETDIRVPEVAFTGDTTSKNDVLYAKLLIVDVRRASLELIKL